jgi:hypothetical protein
MAGKTFHGVGGDFDGESPPLGPDGAASAVDDDGSQPYSGPTIVDEAKIAESLKRLRSLDQPLHTLLSGTLIGISAPVLGDDKTPVIETAVIDPPSSEPTRIDDRPAGLVLSSIGRPTAVGHNVGPGVITQQPPPQLDPMRGTMFGHSIHLPDVDAPEPALEDNSSSGRVVVARPTAEEMKPFLPDRTTRPAQQRDVQQAKPPLAATQVINVVQPLKRVDVFHEPESGSTEVVSGMRQRVRGRTAFMVVAIASAAGVVFAWMYSRETNLPLTLPPANQSAVIPTATEVLAPRPVAASKEVASPTVPPPAAGDTTRPAAPTPPSAAAADTAEQEASRSAIDTGKSAGARRERHRSAATGATPVMGTPSEATVPEGRTAEPKAELKPAELPVAEPKTVEPKLVEAKTVEPKLVEPRMPEQKAVEPSQAKLDTKLEPKPELKPETKVGAKPTKGKKRTDPEEDPDATMAPSD